MCVVRAHPKYSTANIFSKPSLKIDFKVNVLLKYKSSDTIGLLFPPTTGVFSPLLEYGPCTHCRAVMRLY